MKFPKEIRTHCPTCNKHTTHKVHKAEKGSPRSDRWGQRQYKRVLSGYGGQPRPKPKTFAKVSDKSVLILECTDCGNKHVRAGPRTKKMEVE